MDHGQDMDDEFQAFLVEVDQLSINHDAESTSLEEVTNDTRGDSDNDNRKQNSDVSKRSESKRNMIANANNSQRAWSEFKKLDLSNNHNCGNNSGGSKVAFQIKSVGKDKKKKKKKNVAGNNNNTQQVMNQSQRESEIVANYKNNRNDVLASTPSIIHEQDSYDCPRWTLIIDTCTLIDDNGTGVQELIHMANAAAHRCNTGLISEPINIVIPFKVWGELDYQSKKKQSEEESTMEESTKNKAYAARKATRMLRDELEVPNQGDTSNNNIPTILRSQSLLESNKAASRFLPKDSQPTNDDYILACAMMENEKYSKNNKVIPSSSAGGVVIITLDNNLACKAYANSLRVDSPLTFSQYYNKRITSLRQRAANR